MLAKILTDTATGTNSLKIDEIEISGRCGILNRHSKPNHGFKNWWDLHNGRWWNCTSALACKVILKIFNCQNRDRRLQRHFNQQQRKSEETDMKFRVTLMVVRLIMSIWSYSIMIVFYKSILHCYTKQFPFFWIRSIVQNRKSQSTFLNIIYSIFIHKIIKWTPYGLCFCRLPSVHKTSLMHYRKQPSKQGCSGLRRRRAWIVRLHIRRNAKSLEKSNKSQGKSTKSGFCIFLYFLFFSSFLFLSSFCFLSFFLFRFFYDYSFTFSILFSFITSLDWWLQDRNRANFRSLYFLKSQI